MRNCLWNWNCLFFSPILLHGQVFRRCLGRLYCAEGLGFFISFKVTIRWIFHYLLVKSFEVVRSRIFYGFYSEHFLVSLYIHIRVCFDFYVLVTCYIILFISKTVCLMLCVLLSVQLANIICAGLVTSVMVKQVFFGFDVDGFHYICCTK